MAVKYTFRNLGELAEHVRQQGEALRNGAPFMRSKRRQDTALVEAAVFESVAGIISATTLEES